MAHATLSLDEIDHFNTCMLKAKALVKMAGAADISLLHMDGDDNLGKSMWAIAGILDEAKQIIDQAQRKDHPKIQQPEIG